MTKQEILADVDKLCEDIDKWTARRVSGRDSKDAVLNDECHWMLERLFVSARQKLSFLKDYIEKNINDY